MCVHVCVLKLKQCKFVTLSYATMLTTFNTPRTRERADIVLAIIIKSVPLIPLLKRTNFQMGSITNSFLKGLLNVLAASQVSSQPLSLPFKLHRLKGEQQSKLLHGAFSPTSSLVSTLFLICRESLGTCSSPTCFIRLCCLETRVGNKVR